MDADGTNVTRLTDHPANDHDPVWMPDGQSLIFSSTRDSRSDLYRVWLTDRRVERLTHHFVGRAIMPSVSPDGKSVAFAAQTLQRLNFWEFQIHVLDLATGKTPRARHSGGTCWPSWSPDGKLIANVLLHAGAVAAPDPHAHRRAVARAAPRSEAVALLPGLVERTAAGSPSRSAPQHHEGEDWDLAVVAPDGSGYRRLTTGPGNDRLPDWKP